MNIIAGFDLIFALTLELNALLLEISHPWSHTSKMITRLTCTMAVLSITDMSNPIPKKLKMRLGC